MDYKHVTDIEPVASYLAGVIAEHLDAGKRVLWLVSGGSGIHVGIRAAELLAGRDLSGLSVTLTDERYGPVGHPDENWQQLLTGGFTLPGAELYRPLTGQDRDVTTQAFGAWLNEQLTQADYRIGLFGVGSDGHTAGIKPGSPALVATTTATEFTGEDFERITMTFPAIERLDEVVLQAFGDEKAAVIWQLLHENLPLDQQPVQVLKRVPRCTLFTDVEETQ
jgi:6-phosphogluconolactonase/glucosamine-6-phosphate isomerase/deaminase